jgi:hypothetical protein
LSGGSDFKKYGLAEKEMEDVAMRGTVIEDPMQETQVVRSLAVEGGKPSWSSIPISSTEMKFAVGKPFQSGRSVSNIS